VARHSPCIGICTLDEASGYCLGCGRTGAEVGDWIAMSEGQRDAVWEKLPERLAALSVRVRLLPWIRDELVDWVRDSIVARRGCWVVGAPGAVAEFPSTGDSPTDIHVEAGVVTARRSDAAFRIAINEKVRAFAFNDGGPIVLGLPCGRAQLPSRPVLQSLGPDDGAIDDTHRGNILFDMGLGRQYSRFCIRSGDEGLVSVLSGQLGRPWSAVVQHIQSHIIDVGPHRVVESAAARIEVFTRIPSVGQASPSGAHTHFLPEYLKSGEEIAASLAPPDYAAPIAVFYPNKD
jgi:predicted Fe-S protein YdhL (DUF1289 family)